MKHQNTSARIYILTLKFFGLALAIVFMALAFIQNWEELSGYQFRVNQVQLTISVILLIPTYYVAAYAWAINLKMLEPSTKISTNLWIWLISSYARYIPGFIWSFAGRMYLTQKSGSTSSSCIKSMIIENILLALSASCISAPIMLNAVSWPIALLLLASGAIGLVLISSKHQWLSKLMPFTFSEKLASMQVYSVSQLLGLFGIYIVFWIAFSVPFVIFSLSIITEHDLSPEKIVIIALCFPASYFFGLIVAITPGGIGVREAALYWFLSQSLQNTDAIILSVGSRAWLVAGELLNAAIVIQKSKKLISS